MTLRLRIEEPGRSAVTDLGRFGHAHLGVQTSGAADPLATRVANTLVGNPVSAPVIEIQALMPWMFTTLDEALIAVTGAPAAVSADGCPMPTHVPFRTWPGARIRIEPVTAGVRAYVAVRGRLCAGEFLGSVANDPLIGVGAVLEAGDVIEVDDATVPTSPFFPLFRPGWLPPRYDDNWVLRVLPGPELDEFPELTRTLGDVVFTVGGRSDTVGVRLEGPVVERRGSTELLSRGVPMGAIEIPPAGGIIALGRNRPLTAGYPVPFVVARCDQHLLGQLRPGDAVRLRPVDPAAALDGLRAQELRLQELERRCLTMYEACERLPTELADCA